MGKQLWFDSTNISDVDHLKDLENFIDYNAENIPYSVYKELVEIFDETNRQAGAALREHEQQIEELEARITELEQELNDRDS